MHMHTCASPSAIMISGAYQRFYSTVLQQSSTYTVQTPSIYKSHSLHVIVIVNSYFFFSLHQIFFLYNQKSAAPFLPPCDLRHLLLHHSKSCPISLSLSLALSSSRLLFFYKFRGRRKVHLHLDIIKRRHHCLVANQGSKDRDAPRRFWGRRQQPQKSKRMR